MAVAFDNSSSVAFNNTSTKTYTHTPVGTPTAVGVGVGTATISTNTNISTITYGGTTMGAAAVSVTGTTSFPYGSRIYGLANPSSGAQSVAVTWSNGGQYGGIAACTVTGSDTTTCFSAGNTASTNNTGNASLACNSASGELVMDFLITAQVTALESVSGSNTQRESARDASASQPIGLSTIAGAASVTLSWTSGGSRSPDDHFWQCAASFQAAAAGGSFNPGWAYGATKTIGAVH